MNNSEIEMPGELYRKSNPILYFCSASFIKLFSFVAPSFSYLSNNLHMSFQFEERLISSSLKTILKPGSNFFKS